ncbi:lipocalin-like domain-containing protein [Halolactibacillus sp. JCM 19043]|uniref:lipocalin-like domain-containing protein n=1 Tax=Halolactibacillus sp. JCM 19043 TaxID=1460638 RepID=UPI0007847D11|nr:glycoside hydrolase family 43 C-terminal domain-containing protein [Halolactibacillus sp. JCM 19043]
MLKDSDDYFVCHHVREPVNKHVHYVHIRKILWSDEGWPLVSPERFAGEDNREIKDHDLQGQWEFVRIDPTNHDQDLAYQVALTEPKDRPRFIVKPTKNSVKVHLSDEVLDGKVSAGWDWERWCETIVFAGYNHKGVVTMGKKITGK